VLSVGPHDSLIASHSEGLLLILFSGPTFFEVPRKILERFHILGKS